jgi:hypothetical protein
MKEYIQTGSLFSSSDEISVYEFFFTNKGQERGDLIHTWKYQDIVDVIEADDIVEEVDHFGFKIHHVKCEINNNKKEWKVIYSVYRSGFMGGGTIEIEDMDIKIRDIKLKKLL